MLIVFKFGGSSLADPQRITAAARKVQQAQSDGHRTVTVVSAQGNTTDRLLDAALPFAPTKRELDAYLSTGEQQSAALFAMALEQLGSPAISLTGAQAGIVTDSCHTNALVLGLKSQRIRQELAAGRAVVVAGFQGVNGLGDITTLGRGGSDTTAVALAAFLNADECRIYTDVDGVYDKDPRQFPDAIRYDIIHYDQMLALARQGAQVLHDRCVEIGELYRVPIRVLSSFRDGAGTLVTDTPQ